jgi:TonB family protein
MSRRLAPLTLALFALGCGAAMEPAQSAAPPPVASAAPREEPKSDTLSKPAVDKGLGGTALGTPPPQGAPPPPPKAPGAAGVVDAPLAGNITQNDVMAQVSRNMELFNRCYALGAGTSKSWRAKVTVKATVGPSGAVGSAEIVQSTAKNPKVDGCVVEAFKKLSFPRPPGAGATTFTFPLSYDGMEQVQ